VNGGIADKYIVNSRRIIISQKVVTKQRMTDTMFFHALVAEKCGKRRRRL